MKTLIFFLLIILCLSCTKEAIEPTNPGNVTVTLNFGFPSSGNITAKSESPYLNFYTNYISSKVLTPKTYGLTFESIGVTPNFSQGINGKWGNKIFVPLPTGKYAVTGFSLPNADFVHPRYYICGDTCYLRFHDTITITQTSANITLRAYYDCSLLLIDTTDVKSTELYVDAPSTLPVDAIKPTMMKTNEFYHTFLRDGYDNGHGNDQIPLKLKVTSRQMVTVYDSGPQNLPRTYNKSRTLYLYLFTWDAGKYYYFSNTDNGYALLPMIN
jgi:hypothetical protein